MKTTRLWLRWSWRDLRRHWVRVAVIALVIALGTGAYAGLSSSAAWRLASADHNHELLNMYDLRVRLSTGSVVETGTLTDIVESVPSIDSAEERLIVPAQVDASLADETILVRGVIVGVPVAGDGPFINRIHAAAGRPLAASDAGAPVALLERNFAMFYDLPATTSVRVGGDREIEIIGHGVTPEYFIVQPEGGAFFSQANYAALFTSLETAQDLTGVTGVNDLILTLDAGAGVDGLIDDLEAAFADRLPEVGISLMAPEDDLTYTLVYEDIENDQAFFNMLAIVIFAGAVAAAFNLTTRLVEQARREFGIAMALGVPPRRIALRPLLVAAQIALLGALFGLGIGWAIAAAMRVALEALLPFAEWLTPMQVGVFLRAAAAGFLVPFLAAVVPAWRAVRVAPVDAIRTGHLAARGDRPTRRRSRLRIPGDTFTKMPFRNFARAPRRTVLTILGIAASVAVLVLILGAIDSFIATVDRGAAASTAGERDRIIVDLDRVYPTDDPAVRDVLTAATAAQAQPVLRVGGTLLNGAVDISAIIEFVDFDRGLFRPPLRDGAPPDAGAVAISAKAASDLGVSIGDPVRVRHPVREGMFSFSLRETEFEVAGIHQHPFRFYVYMPAGDAELMGLSGLTNSIDLAPVAGAQVGDVQRELFGSSSVVSVQRADAEADLIRDFLDMFISIFRIFEGVVLLLAVLIAFNAAGLGVEERRRDYATMFAYGVPRWKAVRMIMTESTLVGLVATVLGLVGGWGLLVWFIRALSPQSMPHIGMEMLVTPGSVAVAVVVGVVAVGLAPLLTAPRRLGRMDVPSTLRVME